MFQHLPFHFPRLSPWPPDSPRKPQAREQSTGNWKNAFFSIAPELPLAGPPLCCSISFSTFPGFPRGPMIPPGNPKPGHRAPETGKMHSSASPPSCPWQARPYVPASAFPLDPNCLSGHAMDHSGTRTQLHVQTLFLSLPLSLLCSGARRMGRPHPPLCRAAPGYTFAVSWSGGCPLCKHGTKTEPTQTAVRS